MDYNKAALALHSKYPGKIAVQSLAPCKNRDALSTACFVLGIEDSLPLLEQFDSQALFITQERQIYLTSGLEDAFTLSSGDYTLAGTV